MIARLERRAEPAQVEQDDLHAHAGRPDDARIVDALAGAPDVVGGNLPELQEQLLRCGFVRKVAAAVVDAVVVVVPYREVGNGVSQLAVARDALRHGVGALEAGRIFRVEIAVDVVAGEDEKLGLIGENGVPDRLRLDLVGAGAEGDARERRPALPPRRPAPRRRRS